MSHEPISVWQSVVAAGVGVAIIIWSLITEVATRQRAADVDAAERHRAREEWNTRKRRTDWARAHRAHQQAQDRLRLFRSRNGGTPAA